MKGNPFRASNSTTASFGFRPENRSSIANNSQGRWKSHFPFVFGLLLSFAATSFLSLAAPARGNGIDLVEPSSPRFADEYFLSVNAGNANATFSQTGIDFHATFDGRRDIALDLNGGTSAASSKLYGDSFLELDNDANTLSILTLSYGVTAPLNRNFLWSGQFNALAIDVTQVGSGEGGMDLGSGQFSLTLRSGNVVGTSTALINFDHAGTYYFNYMDPGFAGINFSDIDGLRLTLTTTTAGSDFRIGGIYRAAAVPESSSLALLGIGAVGLLFLSWRRRFPAIR